MGDERKICKVLEGKPEEMRPLGRRRRRWKYGIRMDLIVRETGEACNGFIWLRMETGGGDQLSGSRAR
jgi:hypothetical protein